MKYAKGYRGSPQRNYGEVNRKDKNNRSQQVKQIKHQKSDKQRSKRGNESGKITQKQR
jgi:hypothetical protein